jgi:hypothetical protein
MKSKEIVKVSKSLDEVYKQIDQDNKSGWYKSFFPHFVNVTDETRLRLIQDGFKVYEGEWLRGDHGLIIEW